ncbi:MAG: sugar transporter [Rhodovulum sulfidophilum]|uniref:TRAP transporter small permease protein n=1 Tax=Rhodovulum sulfidophilum TaxID=35806 RepID=A0A2W5N7I9_RHOSU|nr:MAG: sugar transporter [Rhodovulum sulfidophilum]
MKGLLRLSGGIDRVSLFFGWISALLVLLSALTSALNALSRYLFNISSNAWLEVQWQMFAGIFLLGAAQVLKMNEHVRVDLFYGSRSHRGKLWTDVFGIIVFLIPSMLVMGFFAWEFFMTAFLSNEHSSNAGGTVLWPVKFLLPLGLFLVLLQGLSELVKRIAGLLGDADETVEYERPVQ